VNLPQELMQRTLSALKAACAFRRHLLKHGGAIHITSTAKKFYAVEKGFVRLTSIQSTGRQVTRVLLGRGALFGELPFVPNLEMLEEVALANGPTAVLEFDCLSAERAMQSSLELQRLLIEALGAQLQILSRRLQWQQTDPLEKRVAMVLYDLMCFGGTPCGHGPGYAMDIRLTHEELAEIVGAARPSVSAVLGKLHQKELISSTRSYLCIRSLERLKHQLSQ